MTIPVETEIEQAIRHSGEGWIIDMYAPRGEALPHIRRTLAAVQDAARRHLGKNAPALSEESLVAEYRAHPQLVRAFFQALGGTRTPVMLLMVWRLIQGMEIKRMDVNYERQQAFSIRIHLESPYGGEDPVYESTSINDFALLRHIGIMQIDDRPVFDGFYPLRVRGAHRE